MYRVFEALDELVQTLEQAYGVPMTSNCMVPRNEMLRSLVGSEMCIRDRHHVPRFRSPG